MTGFSILKSSKSGTGKNITYLQVSLLRSGYYIMQVPQKTNFGNRKIRKESFV